MKSRFQQSHYLEGIMHSFTLIIFLLIVLIVTVIVTSVKSGQRMKELKRELHVRKLAEEADERRQNARTAIQRICSCGVVLKEGAKFCGTCGATLTQPAATLPA